MAVAVERMELEMAGLMPDRAYVVDEPGVVKNLLQNPTWSWIFLPLRLWLGYEWINAAAHKVTEPAWMDGGAALQGYWTRAVSIPEEGRPAIAFDWYREFINAMLVNEWYTWFAKLIAIGQMAVGIALVVGAFTGIAAFFGLTMNVSFVLAGSASTNALLLLAALLLIMGWKVAGYWGIDRWLLPILGTPWTRARVHRGSTADPTLGPATS